jgi:hypothetical protein
MSTFACANRILRHAYCILFCDLEQNTLQAEKVESSSGSAEALGARSPGSAHSMTSHAGSRTASASGAAAAMELHCSASSCCSEPTAVPRSAQKLGKPPRQAAMSAATLRSWGNDEETNSVPSFQRMVSTLQKLYADNRTWLSCFGKLQRRDVTG